MCSSKISKALFAIRTILVQSMVAISPVVAHAQSIPQWRLELMHSIRPAEGSAGALGRVQDLAIFGDGSVVVAETSPARVARYDANGSFARTLMRDGDGPAEARRPKIAAQGDTLVVYDGARSRLTRIGANGRVIDERLVSAAPEAQVWATDDGTIILQIANTPPPWGGGGMRIHPGGRTDTVYSRRSPADELTIKWSGPSWDLRGRTPFAPPGITTFDRSGRLVIGGSRHSSWNVVVGQDTVQRVTLSEHPVFIPSHVRDSVWGVWYSQFDPKKLPQLADVVRKDLFPTLLPPWVTLNIDPQGWWWVGRPATDGELGSWDIVVDGRLVAHVPEIARVTNVFPTGPVMAFGKGVVALLHEDSQGLPWIGVYRVVMKSR